MADFRRGAAQVAPTPRQQITVQPDQSLATALNFGSKALQAGGQIMANIEQGKQQQAATDLFVSEIETVNQQLGGLLDPATTTPEQVKQVQGEQKKAERLNTLEAKDPARAKILRNTRFKEAVAGGIDPAVAMRIYNFTSPMHEEAAAIQRQATLESVEAENQRISQGIEAMAPLVDPTVEGKPLDVQARRTMVTQKALASIDAVGQQVDNLYKVGALTKDNAKVALSGTVNELTQFATLQANGATKGIDFATLDTESKRNLVSNIQGQRAALQAQLVEATKGALDSADIDKMIAPALAQYDAAVDRITKGTEWEKADAENQQQIAQIVAENNLLQSTVKLGETNIKVEDMATLSRVFKHAPGAVEASLGAAAGILFNSLKKNGGWTTLGGSQEDQGATARTVFQGIQNNLMNDNLSMEDTGKGGKTRLSEYDTTLKGLTREFVTDPDNVDVAVKDEALSLFADPAFLRYTTAGADAEALANSAAATGDYLRNEILPSLSDRLLSHVQMPILEREKEAASLGFLDRLTMSPDELYAVRFRDENIPTNALINLIEMPEDVDGVNTIFRLKPEYANNPVAIREVSKLNRVYGKELNKIARAQAHINGGTDYAKGLNDVFANIGMSLPEKDLSLDLPEGGTTRTTSGGLEVTTFKDVDKDQVLATEDADNLAALEAELAQEQATFDAELDADLAALQKEIKGEEAQAAFNAFTDKIKGRLLDTSTGRAGREKSAPQTHEGDIPTVESRTIADTVFDGLLEHEGAEGDTTGAAETGKLGLTKQLRNKIIKSKGLPEDTPDEEVIKSHLTELESKWEAKAGWDKVSDEVKEVLLDSTYNLGESVLRFKGVGKALEAGYEEGVVRNLLDTAQIGGKTSKGVAARRAKQYNKVADVKIAKVQAKKDGEILYLDEDGNVIFSFGKGKEVHSSSKPGTISI